MAPRQAPNGPSGHQWGILQAAPPACWPQQQQLLCRAETVDPCSDNALEPQPLANRSGAALDAGFAWKVGSGQVRAGPVFTWGSRWRPFSYPSPAVAFLTKGSENPKRDRRGLGFSY